MEFRPVPALSQVSSRAMEHLRDMIHENEVLNAQADHARLIVKNFFNFQEHRHQTNLT